MSSGGLTIKELNDALDHLATTENRFLLSFINIILFILWLNLAFIV